MTKKITQAAIKPPALSYRRLGMEPRSKRTLVFQSYLKQIASFLIVLIILL